MIHGFVVMAPCGPFTGTGNYPVRFFKGNFADMSKSAPHRIISLVYSMWIWLMVDPAIMDGIAQ